MQIKIELQQRENKRCNRDTLQLQGTLFKPETEFEYPQWSRDMIVKQLVDSVRSVTTPYVKLGKAQRYSTASLMWSPEEEFSTPLLWTFGMPMMASQ